MNTATNTNTVVSALSPSPSPMRNYLWLIKRELWEHRALYIAPLILAGIILLGTLVGVTQLAHWMNMSRGVNPGLDVNGLDAAMFSKVRLISYIAMAGLFSGVMTIVVGYYSLDALYAERRDRSALFWKSLPISDIETVISKLAVAVVVAPLIGLAFALVTQLLVAGIFTIGLLATGHNFALGLWNIQSIFEIVVLLIYAVIVQALWYLPVWAWCLLASSWSRRSPFLVSIAPPIALAILEAIVFRTEHVWQFIGERLNGVFPLKISLNLPQAFGQSSSVNNWQMPTHITDLINPSGFFASPQLWIGLLVGGALIAATVWMRRYREVN